MTRRLISSGSPFEETAGYSRAVIDGDWAFISGTTGYDYDTMTIPDSVIEQTHNCFKTISKTLEEGGFSLSHAVRMRYVLTDVANVDLVFPVFGEYLGDIRPAATMIIAGLIKPEMKIEIDITAKKYA